mmetsp:Transcript_16085/g.23395  ORF Transcript_16085/g.23395 Transcript_16085/m.23395 type:complete len:113 (-) Transcript_16085:171-509(-)
MKEQTTATEQPDPESWSQAISGEYEDWRRAAAEELGSLRSNPTWELVPREDVPKSAKIRGSECESRARHLHAANTRLGGAGKGRTRLPPKAELYGGKLRIREGEVLDSSLLD